MLFLLLFVIGALAVPITRDIVWHPRNGIVARSGRDLLELPAVRSTFGWARATTTHTVQAGAGLLLIFMLVGIGYLLFRMLAFVLHLFTS